MGKKIDKAKLKIADKLDLPREVILGEPKLLVIGNKEITVENHRGIISFKDNEIIIDTKYGKLAISGEDFEILYLGTSTITLSGFLKEVQYL